MRQPTPKEQAIKEAQQKRKEEKKQAHLQQQADEERKKQEELSERLREQEEAQRKGEVKMKLAEIKSKKRQKAKAENMLRAKLNTPLGDDGEEVDYYEVAAGEGDYNEMAGEGDYNEIDGQQEEGEQKEGLDLATLLQNKPPPIQHDPLRPIPKPAPAPPPPKNTFKPPVKFERLGKVVKKEGDTRPVPTFMQPTKTESFAGKKRR